MEDHLFLFIVITTVAKIAVFRYSHFGGMLVEGPLFCLDCCHSEGFFSSQLDKLCCSLYCHFGSMLAEGPLFGVDRCPSGGFFPRHLDKLCCSHTTVIWPTYLGNVHWLLKEHTKIWTLFCQVTCSIVLPLCCCVLELNTRLISYLSINASSSSRLGLTSLEDTTGELIASNADCFRFHSVAYKPSRYPVSLPEIRSIYWEDSRISIY